MISNTIKEGTIEFFLQLEGAAVTEAESFVEGASPHIASKYLKIYFGIFASPKILFSSREQSSSNTSSPRLRKDLNSMSLANIGLSPFSRA
jgi:hypothetical protein